MIEYFKKKIAGKHGKQRYRQPIILLPSSSIAAATTATAMGSAPPHSRYPATLTGTHSRKASF